MKLSTRSRYAVMAMVSLSKGRQDGPVPLTVIAKDQDISLLYLEQIFTKLRKAGLVESVRGLSGGFKLAKPQSDISVYDIIYAADNPIQMLRCKLKEANGGCHHGVQCSTHHLWHFLENTVKKSMQSVSLEDVVMNRPFLEVYVNLP